MNDRELDKSNLISLFDTYNQPKNDICTGELDKECNIAK